MLRYKQEGLKRYMQKDVDIRQMYSGVNIRIISVLWLNSLEFSGWKIERNFSDLFSESFGGKVDDHIICTLLFGDFGVFIGVVESFNHFIHFLLAQIVHKFPVCESEFSPEFFLCFSGFQEFDKILAKVLVDDISGQ